MARLTAKTRSKIPTGKFALPGRRFPINDKTHARVAKSYASRMVKKGQLSGGQKATIDAKANRMLGKRRGGKMGLRGYKTGGPVPGNVNPFDDTQRVRAALPDYE